MTPIDEMANYALIGQWLCVLGMLVVLGLMLRVRAKEQREKAKREAEGAYSA